MTYDTFEDWFDSFGAHYGDLDDARADYERYLDERGLLWGVLS